MKIFDKCAIFSLILIGGQLYAGAFGTSARRAANQARSYGTKSYVNNKGMYQKQLRPEYKKPQKQKFIHQAPPGKPLTNPAAKPQEYISPAEKPSALIRPKSDVARISESGLTPKTPSNVGTGNASTNVIGQGPSNAAKLELLINNQRGGNWTRPSNIVPSKQPPLRIIDISPSQRRGITLGQAAAAGVVGLAIIANTSGASAKPEEQKKPLQEGGSEGLETDKIAGPLSSIEPDALPEQGPLKPTEEHLKDAKSENDALREQRDTLDKELFDLINTAKNASSSIASIEKEIMALRKENQEDRKAQASDFDQRSINTQNIAAREMTIFKLYKDIDDELNADANIQAKRAELRAVSEALRESDEKVNILEELVGVLESGDPEQEDRS